MDVRQVTMCSLQILSIPVRTPSLFLPLCRSVRDPFPSLPPRAYRQLSIWIDHWQYEITQTTRSVFGRRFQWPTPRQVTTYSQQMSPLLRPEFLSVSLKSGSSVELEPVTIAYVTALQKTSCTHYSTLRLFSLHYTLDSSQEPCST